MAVELLPGESICLVNYEATPYEGLGELGYAGYQRKTQRSIHYILK